MSMEETLQKVLRTLVLPLNDALLDVRVRPMHNSFNDYIVTYYTNDKLQYSDGPVIEKETRSLFKMIGVGKASHILIEYIFVGDVEIWNKHSKRY